MRERLKQRPRADRHDDSCLFGNRYELSGRDGRSVFHIPTHESLEPDHVTQINVDNWLMHEPQFTALKRPIKRRFNRETLVDSLKH